jgi:Peptidase family M28
MPPTNRLLIRAAILCALGICFAAEPPAAWKPALDRISAQSMRGHLSFLASDELEGRYTPSRGLDVAAEYIAAQFRRAGLEPGGDNGSYFQTANLLQLAPDPDQFEMTLRHGEETVSIPRKNAVPRLVHKLDLSEAQIFHASGGDASALARDQVHGRVVVLEATRAARRMQAALQKMEPAAIIRLLSPDIPAMPPAQLIEAGEQPAASAPVILVSDAEAARILRALKPGLSDWKLSVHIAAERATPVKARNVIGVLRGSDAALKDTYVMLTAHYDHLANAESGTDRVYNGANDNASGTVSVIEIGAALATLDHHPRRSIVFMAFFGEEEGLLGSLYYARHPVFPLDKTVADVNLEQIGRTDDTEGPRVGSATFTGFEFSDVPATFRKAGEAVGIKLFQLSHGGDDYFNRSDNLSFAQHGIPAHTAVVAAEFPDYHAVGDEWQKIDYDNMAKVDRMLALGMLMIADNPQPPKWNAEKAGRYANAKR